MQCWFLIGKVAVNRARQPANPRRPRSFCIDRVREKKDRRPILGRCSACCCFRGICIRRAKRSACYPSRRAAPRRTVTPRPVIAKRVPNDALPIRGFISRVMDVPFFSRRTWSCCRDRSFATRYRLHGNSVERILSNEDSKNPFCNKWWMPLLFRTDGS